ncbi:hypothetical protein ZWY2020_017535 [Hordeum vulgare]|nr:hypothetical protein ZWY2020_017535 [Hordeum vulgare]
MISFVGRHRNFTVDPLDSNYVPRSRGRTVLRLSYGSGLDVDGVVNRWGCTPTPNARRRRLLTVASCNHRRFKNQGNSSLQLQQLNGSQSVTRIRTEADTSWRESEQALGPGMKEPNTTIASPTERPISEALSHINSTTSPGQRRDYR